MPAALFKGNNVIRFRMPPHVTVKGVKYKVKLVNGLKYKGEEVLGLHDHENRTISVCSSAKGRLRRQTFVHELFHAYIYECNIREGLDSQLEEVIVDLLSAALEENNLDLRWKGEK